MFCWSKIGKKYITVVVVVVVVVMIQSINEFSKSWVHKCCGRGGRRDVTRLKERLESRGDVSF